MLKKLFFILLFVVGITYHALTNTLVVVSDVNAVDFIALAKIAKYKLHHGEYGTLVVRSFGEPDLDVDLVHHVTEANAPDLPPINKIIFMGHGDAGFFERIDTETLRPEVTRLMNVLYRVDKLAIDRLHILSCNSAKRPMSREGEELPSVTDAIIDGLADANIPGLKVHIHGHKQISITDVFVEGIHDTVRTVIPMRRRQVGAIQGELFDSLTCTGLVADCPVATQELFDGISAGEKSSLRDYAEYIKRRIDLDLIGRARLAYYNQGVRDFYRELIQRSEHAGFLFHAGEGFFDTTFNSSHYLTLASDPGKQLEYLTYVKNGDPSTVDTALPVSAAAASKPSMTRCAYCGKGEADGVKLLLCSRCRNVKYCDRECQKAHWPEHKLTCTSKRSK